MQLLLIRAPKKDNLWGRIKMFFPFFRAFFIGFNKEHFGKNLTFLSLSSATITLADDTPFFIDGERRSFQGETLLSKEEHKARVYLIKD